MKICVSNSEKIRFGGPVREMGVLGLGFDLGFGYFHYFGELISICGRIIGLGFFSV